MAKKKNTNLKLKDIAKQAKKMYETTIHEFENGTTLTFYPEFPELEIESLIEELQQHYLYLKENDIELSDKMNLYLINVLIIKYFVEDFKEEMANSLFADGEKPGVMDCLKHFANTGLLKTIMDEVFLPDQVMKVYDRLTDYVANGLLLAELGEKTQRQLENLKLKNANVLNSFDKQLGGFDENVQ